MALLKLYLGVFAIAVEMIAFLPYGLVLVIVRALGGRAWVERTVDVRVGAWARRCLFWLQCRVVVEGLEHLPREGALVLMSNHQSLLDIPVALGFLGHTMGFVAKRELFRIPALSFWMRQLHCASMDRADVRSSGKLLEDLSAQMRAGGYRFLIFPEGTRTRHPAGEIGAFKRGSLRLSEAQGVPIVPLAIDGTRFIVRPSELARIPPARRVVRVRISPLVSVQHGLSAPESKRLMEALRATIVSNWEAIKVDWRVSAG